MTLLASIFLPSAHLIDTCNASVLTGMATCTCYNSVVNVTKHTGTMVIVCRVCIGIVHVYM